MVTCAYCHAEAELVDGTEIYPHRPDLADKRFYLCRPCKAYVGCHPGTMKPMGRLANKELRYWKMAAHRAFDSLWKGKWMRRAEAYEKLSTALNLAPEHCHIGMFDVDLCKKVIEFSRHCMAEMDIDL